MSILSPRSRGTAAAVPFAAAAVLAAALAVALLAAVSPPASPEPPASPPAPEAPEAPASPEAPFWTPTQGPDGGEVHALARDANGVLYAGTAVGLFRRAPADAAWTRVDGPVRTQTYTDVLGRTPAALRVQQVTPLPDGGLAARFLSLERSPDDGQTWSNLGRDLRATVGAVTALVPVPDGAVYAPGARGLARSTDGGQTWARVLGEGDGTTRADAVARLADGTLYALGARYDAGYDRWRPRAFASTDGGATWTQRPAPPATIRHLAATPRGTLWALSDASADAISDDGSAAAAAAPTLYRYTPGDKTWSAADMPPDALPEALTADAAGRVYLLSADGLYRLVAPSGTASSEASGPPEAPTWARVPVPTTARVQAVLGSREDTLLVGTTNGILRSTDDGATWKPFDRGLHGTPIARLVSVGSQVYALGDGRLYRSDDDGRTFVREAAVPPEMAHLARGPQGVVYAAGRTALHRRAPDDTAWQHVADMPAPIEALAVASDGVPLLNLGDELVRYDGGFERPGLARGSRLRGPWTGPGGGVLVDRGDAGVHRSVDGGRWFRAVPDDAVLDTTRTGHLRVAAFGTDSLAVCAVQESDLVLCSSDQGATWSARPAAGLTYRPPPDAAPRRRSLRHVVLAPDGVVLVGARTGGVYLWELGARAWRPVLRGLPSGEITALHVTASGHALAATPLGLARSSAPITPSE